MDLLSVGGARGWSNVSVVKLSIHARRAASLPRFLRSVRRANRGSPFGSGFCRLETRSWALGQLSPGFARVLGSQSWLLILGPGGRRSTWIVSAPPDQMAFLRAARARLPKHITALMTTISRYQVRHARYDRAVAEPWDTERSIREPSEMHRAADVTASLFRQCGCRIPPPSYARRGGAVCGFRYCSAAVGRRTER